MRFHDKRFALEYEHRLRKEGYPGKLYPIIKNELMGYSTIIDIGAGTGFFTLPLAHEGYNLTAIEPSIEMIKLMNKKITGDISERITVIHSDWESWNGEKRDCAICVHAIYPMKNIELAVLKMAQAAGKGILLIRADQGNDTLSGRIRKAMGLNNCKDQAITATVRNLFARHNVEYAEKEINDTRTIRFNSIDEEAAYFIFHLGIDQSRMNELKKIILNQTQEKDGFYIFKSTLRDLLFTFKGI